MKMKNLSKRIRGKRRKRKNESIVDSNYFIPGVVVVLLLVIAIGGATLQSAVAVLPDGTTFEVESTMADELSDGGIGLMENQSFPRATTKLSEVWAIEVNGEWAYVTIDWNDGVATKAISSEHSADVVIRTNNYIAVQLYNLANGESFDGGILGLNWLFTGVYTPNVEGDNYKAAIEEWATGW